MGRIVIIGDVGGHAGQLAHALVQAGITGEIPAGVTVIQVGDLIDRGPSSEDVLALVDRHLTSERRGWIQLAGNHEAQYLPGGTPFWPEYVSPACVQLLTKWWDDGLMQVAAAVHTDDGDEYLVTHAGLTVACWRELGEPMTASTAGLLLNERPEFIWRGGQVAVDRTAGPLWAEAGWELHEPWMEHYDRGGFVPFGQISGHSSIVGYADQTWRAPGKVRQRARVDWEARHTFVRIGGRQFVGVDPKHGRTGAPQWQPLVLTGEVALA